MELLLEALLDGGFVDMVGGGCWFGLGLGLRVPLLLASAPISRQILGLVIAAAQLYDTLSSGPLLATSEIHTEAD